ncbi:MAG: ABC transporter permease [Oscillospiraceae bacterium]|nr:ABC transporter permease [Oscillospiraceae bacterium]
MDKVRFIIKRILQIIPMLLIISILAFILSNLSNGDAAEIAIRKEGGIVTEQTLAAKREELGLNKPLVAQYFDWLGRAVRFDFGDSFISKKPVIEEVMSRFPNTLYLALIATAMALAIAIPIALLSVKWKGSALDHGLRVLTTGAATMPDFWLGLMLLYGFGVSLGVVPVIAGSNLANIFLPAFTLSISYAAIYTRMLRSNLIEVMQTHYIKAARAKGLGEWGAMVKHGLKNAVLPCVTLVATNFGSMLGGAYAVEMIFSWNGIGKYAIESVKAKDFPVIQCYLIAVALAYIGVNLLVDILYAYIDPKIKLEGGKRRLWFKR